MDTFNFSKLIHSREGSPVHGPLLYVDLDTLWVRLNEEDFRLGDCEL